ncbi:MAG: 1-acyl-sn-glycerol-3-phosphate acyltransferase, partial [Chloroflexota bacterium]|nr:1-acyl-sn-glycerol-3-phosphate acyltransferase [Chloroflexota bacterium]
PTLIVSNHKRDLDSMILPSVCYFAGGFPRANHRLNFGIREDIFWPRFLAEYVAWPALLKPAIARLNLSPVVTLLKGQPVGYLTSRKELPRIRRQLAHLIDLLERGNDVYWTPEGGRTLDGRFGRVRAGLHRIIRECRAPLAIRPVAIFYDFATSARTRCFIRFGPELWVDPSWSRTIIERKVRDAVLRQMTVSLGHVAAGALSALPQPFGREQLDAQLRQGVAAHRARGHFLDPRLTSSAGSFRRRVDEFLAYAGRQNILVADRDGWRLSEGLGHPGMAYLLNELAEIEPSVRAVAASGAIHPPHWGENQS